MREHQNRVGELSRNVASFYLNKKPFKIFHGSTNSTRIQIFKRDEMIDVSDLNHVLQIDPKKKLAFIEPNVPMDALVKSTMRYGLLPAVVMEFPGITAGGGVQGGAAESSSFRYGGFHEICESYELVLPDGTIATASSKENADIYHGIAGSYGTLALLTGIHIRLIPAKRFVNLTYLPVGSFDEAISRLQACVSQNYDYIDGIMFNEDSGVVMVGTLADTPASNVRRFSRASDEWFYLHAAKMSSAGESTESVPIVDYLFRYDRGAFWVGSYAFRLLGVPFTRFWRTILNPLLHTRQLYEAMQESGMSQRHLVQDIALPVDKAAEFMQFVSKNYSIFPLWLCPLKTDTHSDFISSHLQTNLVINVGVWGDSLDSYEAFLDANKVIEHEVARLGGKKWLYAHSYYSESDFWKLYDKTSYDALRKKYNAEYLPTVYEKVHVTEQHPIDTHRGVWRTLFRTAKLKIVP